MSSFSNQLAPHCNTCKKAQEYGRDDKKRYGLFWKNCQRCRDKHTSSKRKKRELSPVALHLSTMSSVARKSTTSSARLSTILAHSHRGKVALTVCVPKSRRLNHAARTDCSVCSDTFSAKKLFRLRQCVHKPQVCRGCFKDWLTSQVGTTSWNRIVCPSEGCGVLITHEEMKSLASEETYTR
jgi:hypothetical protein